MKPSPQDWGDELAEAMGRFVPMFNGKVKIRILAKTAMVRYPKPFHQSTCQPPAQKENDSKIRDPWAGLDHKYFAVAQRNI